MSVNKLLNGVNKKIVEQYLKVAGIHPDPKENLKDISPSDQLKALGKLEKLGKFKKPKG